MEFSVVRQDGLSETIELSESVFAHPFNQGLVHQVVTACLANARQGTRAQKSRAEVRGGGKKPWRQKGTGRARAGSIRSPLWRKGGVTFAAKSQDFSQKINKKMYRGALRAILSELVKSGRLVGTDIFEVAQPKTHVFLSQLERLCVSQKTMIVSHEINQPLYLASRNVPRVYLCLVQNLNPVDLVRYEKTIITLPALKKLEAQLV